MFTFTEIEPESPRYAVDLVLLHGLWTGGWIWRGLAAGLAHRGWRCVLADRLSSPEHPTPRVAELTGALHSQLVQRESPAIVMGHDLGGTVALQTEIRQSARAVVAFAPLLEGLPRYLPAAKRLWALFLGALVAPPTATHPYLVAEPEPLRSVLLSRFVGEPASLALHRLRGAELPVGSSTPTLLVGFSNDPLTSSTACAITARGIDADYGSLEGGHWALAQSRVDPMVRFVHRWLIQKAGSDLLLLRGDEDLLEDELI
jgi:pimeloyl-ACP methyl ester carboxylesterase